MHVGADPILTQGGVFDELDIGVHGRVQGQKDALAVAADAGQHVQDRAGGNLGGFAAGDPARDGIVLPDGGRDGVFLVIILNVAIADRGRPVVQDR